ncbi:MAG: hypothetical protein KGH72_05195 [Candidatus Micrarchaeota archaeon]|nr:hypothetical protein [Candidatus Micrarchaeota archaeon]
MQVSRREGRQRVTRAADLGECVAGSLRSSTECEGRTRSPAKKEQERRSACQADMPPMEWGMFAQAIIGERITNAEGEEVFKIAMVSFTMPTGFEDRGAEIIKAALRGNNGLDFMQGKTVSFNADNTLLGCFGASQSGVGEMHTRVLADLYNSANHATMAYGNGDDAANFQRFHNKRMETLGVLAGDINGILSSPEHLGSSAFDPRFGSSWRMEGIFSCKDGRILIPDPEGKMTDLATSLISAEHDFGHTLWLNAFLKFVKAAHRNGAKSFFGFQVDGTASVAACGGSDVSKVFYLDSLVYGTTATGAVQIDRSTTAKRDGSKEQGGGGQSSSDETGLCASCGKSKNAGQCACGNRGAHHSH